MINERISLLRKAMQNDGLDAVIFPSNDPHQSEYVSDYWKIREYFSGFTGSAGTLVVSQFLAALWTDSRYFLQVEQECAHTAVELYKQSIPHAPEHVEWIVRELTPGSKIGVDFRLFSKSQIEYIHSFADLKQIEVVDIPHLVDAIWTNRPESGNAPIKNHSIEYCGERRSSKLSRVINVLEQENADFLFVSSLDEIAWLFNLRSKDVDFTPLATAYALVGKKEHYLFIDEHRLEEDLVKDFQSLNVLAEPYSSITERLSSIPSEATVLSDGSSINYACYSAISGKVQLKPSFIQDWKAIKNEVEIENAKHGMLKDGIALTRFFIWLENHLEEHTISEYDLGVKLESFRKEQSLYTGQSFGCIVGYKGNGAIIHYSAPQEGSANIQNEGILLLDSGAQYENATTDITRTIWLGGIPSEEEKTAYTLVLKGYIELERMQFPKGTVGMQLDTVARMHLWKHGLNYGHGTGHGIGLYGMVHEPKQGFATSATTFRGTSPHLENQLTTIEPGFYKPNAFGIRTENIVLSKVVQENDFGTFLGFEPITLCYIDTQLIDFTLMTQEEIDWLNGYHAQVYSQLAKHLSEKEKAWLKEKCQPVN